MEPLWTYKEVNQPAADNIAATLNCHKIIATLLVNRGILTPDKAMDFLNPSLDKLTDPFALKDMDRAVERIRSALENHEKILVFGDFDADGVTATSLLIDFLSVADADLFWYIPHRIKEGFSLKKDHIRMAADQDTDLIITVDCGSDSHDAVEAARKEDIDVIVTDHHEIRETPPPAVAVVNPKREDCTADLSHLAGVGVAFYLIIALRMVLRDHGFWDRVKEPNLVDYCDLVAIGTIADMVPLTDENRILSITGINVMKKKKRVGINAIAAVSNLNPETMDSDDISYRIAPRINAAGRMSHARICINLLTSKGEISARQTAQTLESLNRKRQQTEGDIIEEIENILKKNPDLLTAPAFVLENRSWNPGVLGIAASKTASKYGRPVILISTSKSPATGSCRSIYALDIYQALSNCSHLLEKFGGHRMAAGITIKKKNIVPFFKEFKEQILLNTPSGGFKKIIPIDCFLDLDEITKSFILEVDRLRPFGNANPEPVFFAKNIKVVSSTIIGSKHRKMVLQKADSPSDKRINALHFNIPDMGNLKTTFEKIAFKVRMNRYNNRADPQIIIEQS